MTGSAVSTDPPRPGRRRRFSAPTAAALWVVGLWAVLAAIRLSAPSDLMDLDQERPVSYAADIIHHGRWIVQRDIDGEIASKPPLVPWLAAGCAWIFGAGRLSHVTAALPSTFATLAVGLMLARGCRAAGGRVALLAASAWLMSGVALKQLSLTRTDPVFSALVFAGALLGLRARRAGTARAWTWFWLAAAAASLAKSPVGVALMAMAPLAAAWGAPRDARTVRRGFPAAMAMHGPGVALFLALTVGWLAAALAAEGRPVWDKMIGRELVGHIVAGDKGEAPGTGWWKPGFYFFTRFAPWGLLAVPAAVAVLARRNGIRAGLIDRAPGPRLDLAQGCAGLLLGGLAMFSAAGHQRQDLILPLVPPAALLAGMVLARMAPARLPTGRLAVGLGAMAVSVSVASFVGFHQVLPDQDLWRRTALVRRAAREFVAAGGDPARLVHFNTPFAFQLELGTCHRTVPLDDLIRRYGALGTSETLTVAYRSDAPATDRLDPDGRYVFAVGRWPADTRYKARVAIVSNRPPNRPAASSAPPPGSASPR